MQLSFSLTFIKNVEKPKKEEVSEFQLKKYFFLLYFFAPIALIFISFPIQ